MKVFFFALGLVIVSFSAPGANKKLLPGHEYKRLHELDQNKKIEKQKQEEVRTKRSFDTDLEKVEIQKLEKNRFQE